MYVHISVRTIAADTAPEHFQRTDFLTMQCILLPLIN